MGARQSVAQPANGRTEPLPSQDQGLATLSSNNSHSALNEASSSGLAGNRPRNRHQIRSRSMASSTQVQSDVEALIAALNQHRANRLLAEAIARNSSDQSSDSENDEGALAGGVATRTSLNRLLRLNSISTDSPSTSSSDTRVWLPPFSFRYFEIKCPLCSKTMPFDDVECHIVMCLTRPRIVYNDEVLTEDRGECVICFDEMLLGDTIARLPCLCVYHKTCIDSWFKVKNSCPAHPGDD